MLYASLSPKKKHHSLWLILPITMPLIACISVYVSVVFVFVWLMVAPLFKYEYERANSCFSSILQFKYKFSSIRPLVWRHAIAKGHFVCHYKLLNCTTATTTTTTHNQRLNGQQQQFRIHIIPVDGKNNTARHKLAYKTMSAKNAKKNSHIYLMCVSLFIC